MLQCIARVLQENGTNALQSTGRILQEGRTSAFLTMSKARLLQRSKTGALQCIERVCYKKTKRVRYNVRYKKTKRVRYKARILQRSSVETMLETIISGVTINPAYEIYSGAFRTA